LVKMDTYADTKGKESREVEAATGFEPVNNGFAVASLNNNINEIKHLA